MGYLELCKCFIDCDFTESDYQEYKDEYSEEDCERYEFFKSLNLSDEQEKKMVQLLGPKPHKYDFPVYHMVAYKLYDQQRFVFGTKQILFIYFESCLVTPVKKSKEDWDPQIDKVTCSFNITYSNHQTIKYNGIFQYWYNGHNADGIEILKINQVDESLGEHVIYRNREFYK